MLSLLSCSEPIADVRGRGQALEQDDDSVWITADPEVAAIAQRLLGVTTEVQLPSSEQGVSSPVALRVPTEALAWISELAHEERHRCGGYVLHTSEAAARKALLVSDDDSKPLRRADYPLDNGATVRPLLDALDESNVLGTIRELSSFRNRFHTSMTGRDAAEWIRDSWLEIAAGRDDIEVELIDHERTPQPSIAMTLHGSELPDEIVVLGGHMDSIAGRGSAYAVAPGADDNASGIAVLTEIARTAVALDYRPERTVVFYGYAAEEIGLVGSGEIAAAAEAEGRDVVGVMQLDMTNYTSADEPYIGLTDDYTDATLNAFSVELIETYLDIPWKYYSCGYGCSDHASWHERGFPATFPHEADFREGNQSIHTANDTLQLSDNSAQHSMHFARFGAAFMAELAKGTLGGAASPACDHMPCGDAGTDGAISACDAAHPCPAGMSCEAGSCVPDAPQAADAGPDDAGASSGAGSDDTDDEVDGDRRDETDSGAARPLAPVPGVQSSAGCSFAPGSSPARALWLLVLALAATRRRGR